MLRRSAQSLLPRFGCCAAGLQSGSLQEILLPCETAFQGLRDIQKEYKSDMHLNVPFSMRCKFFISLFVPLSGRGSGLG